jgi:hypothetical protein
MPTWISAAKRRAAPPDSVKIAVPLAYGFSIDQRNALPRSCSL